MGPENATIEVGGSIQFDVGFFGADSGCPSSDDGVVSNGNAEDGVEFRRARIYAKGEIDGTTGFMAQYTA